MNNKLGVGLAIMLVGFLVFTLGASSGLTINPQDNAYYFRGDAQLVNGLSCSSILTSQSGTLFTAASSAYQDLQVGIKVSVRHADGSESQLTPSGPVAIDDVNSANFGNGGGGQLTSDVEAWNGPGASLVSSDAIVIRFYFSEDGSGWFVPNNNVGKQLVFSTGQVGGGVSQLKSATWQVTYQIYADLYLVGYDSNNFPVWGFDSLYLGYGTGGYSTQINGVSWTASSTPTPGSPTPTPTFNPFPTPTSTPMPTPAPTPSTVAVTFSETGLQSGSSWAVSFNSAIQGSTTNTIGFTAVPGSYSYYIYDVAGYTLGVAQSGSLQVTSVGYQFYVTYNQNAPSSAAPTLNQFPTSTPTLNPTPTLTPQVTLTMGLSGQGSVSPGVGSHVYNFGSPVTIVATAGNGYQFSYWLFDDSSTSSSSSIMLTLSQSRSALAVFTLVPVPTPTPVPGATPTPYNPVTPTPSPSLTPIPVASPTPIPVHTPQASSTAAPTWNGYTAAPSASASTGGSSAAGAGENGPVMFLGIMIMFIGGGLASIGAVAGRPRQ